jgi:hypothetical protein
MGLRGETCVPLYYRTASRAFFSNCFRLKSFLTMTDKEPSNKRQRELAEPPQLSDMMRLARSIWHPANPYEQRSEHEEDRDFRETFGKSAAVCLLAFNKLRDYDLLPPGGELRHFLWSLMYWKSDGKKRTLARLCGGISKDTLRKWSRLFADALSELEGVVVSLLVCNHVSLALPLLLVHLLVATHRLTGRTGKRRTVEPTVSSLWTVWIADAPTTARPSLATSLPRKVGSGMRLQCVFKLEMLCG